MTYVSDVAHVAKFVSEKPEIPRDDIESEERARVAQVHIIIDGRATYVHADKAWHNRLKFFFYTCKGVGKMDRILFVAFHSE
jgi:hypothetical protein